MTVVSSLFTNTTTYRLTVHQDDEQDVMITSKSILTIRRVLKIDKTVNYRLLAGVAFAAPT